MFPATTSKVESLLRQLLLLPSLQLLISVLARSSIFFTAHRHTQILCALLATRAKNANQ